MSSCALPPNSCITNRFGFPTSYLLYYLPQHITKTLNILVKLSVVSISDARISPKTKNYLRHRFASNMSQKKESMLQRTQQLLINFYKPFNIQLARLLNDTRYLWNNSWVGGHLLSRNCMFDNGLSEVYLCNLIEAICERNVCNLIKCMLYLLTLCVGVGGVCFLKKHA